LIAASLAAMASLKASPYPKQAISQPSPAPVVSKIVIVADNAAFTGKCPHKFKFTATIYYTGSGKLEYKWLRSDGGHQLHNPTIQLNGGGKETVTYEWTIGKNFQGWVSLETVTPTPVKSNNANFQLTCN